MFQIRMIVYVSDVHPVSNRATSLKIMSPFTHFGFVLFNILFQFHMLLLLLKQSEDVFEKRQPPDRFITYECNFK